MIRIPSLQSRTDFAGSNPPDRTVVMSDFRSLETGIPAAGVLVEPAMRLVVLVHCRNYRKPSGSPGFAGHLGEALRLDAHADELLVTAAIRRWLTARGSPD